MKYLLLLLLVPTMAHSQKIIENQVDDFTKNNVIRTSWDPFTRSGRAISFSQFSKINSLYFLYIKINLKGGPFSVGEGDKLMLMAENDSILTLLNSKYQISCRGCGAIGIAYSAMDGVELSFHLSESDVQFLLTNKIKKMRLYTTSGYIEEEVKAKFAETFNKQLSIIP